VDTLYTVMEGPRWATLSMRWPHITAPPCIWALMMRALKGGLSVNQTLFNGSEVADALASGQRLSINTPGLRALIEADITGREV